MELIDTTNTTVATSYFAASGIFAVGAQKNLTVKMNEFEGGTYGYYSFPSSTVDLDGADFCGNVVSHIDPFFGAIFIAGGRNVTLRGNHVSNSTADGIQVTGVSNLLIAQNEIRDSAGAGVRLLSTGANVHNNSFVNNGAGDVFRRDTDATKNWWGSASGPSGAGPGAGEPIFTGTANVLFDPWLGRTPELNVDCDSGGPL